MPKLATMKRPLRKLSPGKQPELDLYVQIIDESFAKAVATRKADRLRNGRILKVTLYLSEHIALLREIVLEASSARIAELRAVASHA